jgi:hypothetical protein
MNESHEVARHRTRMALEAKRSTVSRSLSLDEIDLKLIDAGFAHLLTELDR